jgi:hypothetical protein
VLYGGDGDGDGLLESYAGMASEALDEHTSEEHRRIYGMLRLQVVAQLDGGIEVNGFLGSNLGVCHSETTSTRRRLVGVG